MFLDFFLEFPDELSLDATTLDFVKSSVECTNEEPITGDTEDVSVDELKSRVLNSFAGQNRAVTQQDYVANVYSMPTKFGAIKRSAIHRDPDSLRRNMNLYVVSEDHKGNSKFPSGSVEYIMVYIYIYTHQYVKRS